MLPVLAGGRREPVREEPLRVGENPGQAMGNRRRHHGHGAGGHDTAPVTERFKHLPDQQYQRRVQPFAFAHGVFHRRLALKAVEAHGPRFAVNLPRLLPQPRQVRGRPEKLQAGPGRKHRAGVLAREQHGQQDSRDLVVAERTAVLVARVHERLHEVVRTGSCTPARRHDLAEELRHLPAGPVAASMRRGGEPGKEEPERVDALLQVVIGLGEAGIHPVANLLPDQAAAGDPDGELVHRVRQVDFALPAESVGESARLLEHDEGESPHGGFAERGKQEPQLLRHDFRRGVIGHAAPEDGHGEAIDRLGVQLGLGRPEIEVMGFRPGEENEIAESQPEAEQVAMPAPAAAQHGDRVALKFPEVADQRPAARQFRNGRLRPRREVRRLQGRHAVGPVRHPRPQWMNGSIEKRARCV